MGGTRAFAGLNGGNPAKRVIALAAWTLYSPAGISCNQEGCKNKPLGLPALSTPFEGKKEPMKSDVVLLFPACPLLYQVCTTGSKIP